MSDLFTITTGDPRYDPSQPVKINGRWFVPVPDSTLVDDVMRGNQVLRDENRSLKAEIDRLTSDTMVNPGLRGRK